MTTTRTEAAVRYHDMDALRAVAMILGIALHGALSFVAFPWSVQDSEQHEVFGTFFFVVHGFRMPVFFVMSGFFTAMLWRRRGLVSILQQRFMRVFLPCMVGIFTICPLQDWVGGFVYTQESPAWPFQSDEAERSKSDELVTEDEEVSTSRDLSALARKGQLARIEELLAEGADINARDEGGVTALHWAAVVGEEEIAARLIEEGADVDAKTPDGSRPLHWAAFLGEPALVEFLLAADADPGARNKKGETPLDTVRTPWSRDLAAIVLWIAGLMQIEVDLARIEADRPEIVALLDEASVIGLDLTGLTDCARRGDLAGVKELLAAGTDPEDRAEDQTTALHWAAVQGHFEIVEALFDAGADPNIRSGDGGTPLHWTAFLGEVEMVELLLEAGADPNVRNHKGESPLDTVSYPWNEAIAGITEWIAGIMQLEVDLEQIEADRPAVIAALKGAEGGGGEGALGRWIEGLMFKNVFHHLWFLWFLCWLVAAFTVYALVAQVVGLKSLPGVLITSPLRYLWLLPLTLLPQLVMHGGGAQPGFGPDTATGWLPFPHLLLYHAIFFFFGAFYFDAKDEGDRLGSWWWLTLPLALLVVFPLAMEFSLERSWSEDVIPEGLHHLCGAALEVVFVWLMIFGLIGMFRRLCRRESRVMRYVSDSSYWLYLAHLPLILLGQWFVREWPLSPFIKFPLVCGAVTLFLLGTYQLFVRYTPIGTFLNGKRLRVQGER